MDDAARQAMILRVMAKHSVPWTQAQGCRVRHRDFGLGTIVYVYDTGLLEIVVRFDQASVRQPRPRFKLVELLQPSQFPERLGFPDQLEEAIVHLQDAIATEEKKVAHEAALLERYRQERQALRDRAGISGELAGKALLGEPLTEAEIRILEEHRKYYLLARYYEGAFKRTNDDWHLIRASSAWRCDGKPGVALKVTEPLLPRLAELPTLKRSALLTTRGAAYRDREDLENAETCARQAIECHPGNARPYNLLAAIRIQQGRTADGERLLAEAERLSPNVKEQRGMIERSLASLDGNERRRIVQELQRLNPERYAWLSWVHDGQRGDGVPAAKPFRGLRSSV